MPRKTRTVPPASSRPSETSQQDAGGSPQSRQDAGGGQYSRQDAGGTKGARKRAIEKYEHGDKERINNPQVGLVTPQTDPVLSSRKTYEHFPPVPSMKPGSHLDYDPHLDPQLVWAGKAEHTSFEVPTVSLHVHERIDPRTIIEAVRKRNGNGAAAQGSLFAQARENRPLREEIDFYRHAKGWSNRLVAGDSLLVMNSLLEKEGMAGQVQMVYIDPPYGIKYGSNFQPFVNKRDVKDGKDEDLTQEPEMVRAFRDTWELGIHSYLTYLRDRLLLARELLHESGSCFVQISDENLHLIRSLMDDVLKAENFVAIISFQKKGSQSGDFIPSIHEYVVWYAKDKESCKFRRGFVPRDLAGVGGSGFDHVELADGSSRDLTDDEKSDATSLPRGSRPFRFNPLFAAKPGPNEPVKINGVTYPSGGNSWKVNPAHIPRLFSIGRVIPQKTRLVFKRYAEDFNFVPLTNIWHGLGGAREKMYVVQTNEEVVKRCLLMTTDPGDAVLDVTCGSGTTAYVAEEWGRRWITCDTSRVAITLAKQRLMAADFDYYELAHPDEGVGSGFRYKTVPHVTLKSIANNPEIREGMTREQIDHAIARYADQETLYDQPFIDKSRVRVTGPFTVEAVPAPTVRPMDDLVPPASSRLSETGQQDVGGTKKGRLEAGGTEARGLQDASIARSGPALRHAEWRDELLKTGVRGRAGQMIHFSRVEPLGGTRWLHADAETKATQNSEGRTQNKDKTMQEARFTMHEGRLEAGGTKAERVVVSFGPEHGPLEQRQVEMAWEEARTLAPRPAILLFAAFQFDPEAAKDIDELSKEKAGMTLLKALMNGDLLTEDLKKKRSSNQSFWLIGSPDVQIKKVARGKGLGARDESQQYIVEVMGFDYFNMRTGTIDSGDTTKIAMWLLDTDYDGRSLLPRQVFFPMAGETEGWAKLARNLKAEIDPELIEAYRGTVSLPFEAGSHRRVAVKVIDDRGIESLQVLNLS